MNRPAKLRLLTLVFLALCLAACEKPAEKEARYLKQGNVLFERGDYTRARLEYKNAAQIMPTDAEPRYRLGLVDEAEGDPRNAFADFISAEQQNSHYHPALLKLAQYFTAVEEYDQADHRLAIVLAETPDDTQGHALRAAILLRRKEYDGTEKEARLALAKDPANLTAISALTGLYSAQHDQAKALAVLEEGIRQNPQSLPLLVLRVMVYEQSSDITKIAEGYQAIFRLRPTQEVFRNDLAKIYLKFGKVDEAEATLRAGVAAMPNDWSMKKDLVAFLSESRGLDISEREIRTLMQQNPGNTDLYFWLADLYISHNATDKAVALLEQIIAKDASDRSALSARTSLARIQFVGGNRAVANKLIAAVLEKDPGNVDALFIRAQMEFDLGHYQEAVADLRVIIRDNPGAEDAFKLLAETLLLQGHLDLAIDTLNQLVDTDPANMSAVVRLAQMSVLNGNTSRAMDLLDTVTKTHPDYALGWESMARIAISEKDWKTAQSAIAKLDALPGQHMLAVFLQGQVLDMNGRTDQAIPAYMQIFNSDPSSPLAEHALSSFVEAKQRLNRLPDAVATLSLLKPTPFITTLLGGCFEKLGKIQDAAAAFDKAIAENDTSQAPYIARAQLHLKDKQPEKALAILAKAHENAPSDMHASLLTAVILEKLGRYPEAAAIYEDILTHNPNADAAANNYAQMLADHSYADASSMDKARQIAERFSGSANPLYLDTLGWVYFRLGNLQQAQAIMTQVAESKDLLPPEVHYHYASLLLKLGKAEEAKAELKQATPDGADYSGLEDAQKMNAKLSHSDAQ